MQYIRRGIKLVLATLFLASVVLNVGMLASTAIATTVSGAFSALTGTQSALERTVQKRNRLLLEQQARVQQRKMLAVNNVSTRIRQRVVKGTTRDLGAMFGEAIPYFGIAAIVGATAWDLNDACDTMKDLRSLEEAFGSASDAEQDLTTVCGQTVPTKEEVWLSVKNAPDRAWSMAKEQMPTLPETSHIYDRLTLPDLPQWLQWWKE